MSLYQELVIQEDQLVLLAFCTDLCFILSLACSVECYALTWYCPAVTRVCSVYSRVRCALWSFSHHCLGCTLGVWDC